MRTLRVLLLTGLFLTLGCDGVEILTSRPESIQTDRASYVLTIESGYWATDISYTFTNRTSRTIYYWQCLNGRAIRLEKSVNGEWLPAWAPGAPQCLPPLIAVNPGASVVGVMEVRAGFPGSQERSPFAFEDPEGEYRLVWDFHVEADILSDLIPLESRVSHGFLLVLGE